MACVLASALSPTPAAATPTVTEFSAGITAGGAPYGIAVGPDGNLWFTEDAGGRIGRITPAGVVTEFSTGVTPAGAPQGITAGPDGNLWFTEENASRIGRITPAGVVTEFSAGITPNSGPRGITAGPDGNLWFTESGRIGRITPAGVVTEFSAGITAGIIPDGIVAGPDGNLWFTENYQGDRVGRITPAGVVTEFSAGITAGSFPRGIVAGPDGNLWFTEFSGDRVGRITPAGVVTEFSAGITAGSGPQGIVVGPDGNLWFTEYYGGHVGRITLTGVVTEFSAGITPASGPRGIVAGPDGDLWFAESTRNAIGRITADLPPVVATGAASGVSQSAAMLASSVNPGGEASMVSFQYGASTGYGSSSAAEDAGAGSTPIAVSAALTGLVAGTVYHYRAVASNPSGISYGADATFTTSAPPLLRGTAPGVSRYGITNNPFVVGAARTPTFGSAAAKKSKHKRGTTFRYTLSEVASVKIVISERVAGRRNGRSCAAPSKKLARAKRCTRIITLGTLTRVSHLGANNVAFSGRIGSKPLRPGGYQATITATDAAKLTSKPQTISFTIVTR